MPAPTAKRSSGAVGDSETIRVGKCEDAACGFSLDEALERAGELRLPVRTVVVDGDAHFSRPAPRLAVGVRQLAHLLHPEAVANPAAPFAELPLGVAAV